MGAILSPHTKENEWREQACHTESLHRTHGQPRRRVSGPWRMLPWRERAKPLGVGWQRLMLVVLCVVCCFLWLYFVVVFCAAEQLSDCLPVDFDIQLLHPGKSWLRSSVRPPFTREQKKIGVSYRTLPCLLDILVSSILPLSSGSNM